MFWRKRYNVSMQKDPLEKLETASSLLPRQTNRSLAKLPKPPRRWTKLLLGLIVIAATVVAVWYAKN